MVKKEKARILMLLNCPLIGGAEVYSLTLAEGLIKRGHSIFIACNNRELNGMLSKTGARVFHMRWGKKVGGIRSAYVTMLFYPILCLFFFILLACYKIKYKTTVLHVQFMTQ